MTELASADVGPLVQLWERRKLLGSRTAVLPRLFLDLRYWNDLCDAQQDATHSHPATSLLDALRSAVRAHKIVCPVEFHMVEELHKQKNDQKRATTLALIDELSTRTVLSPEPDRIFLEVLRLVQSLVAGALPSAAPVHEMWTRPMFAAGHSFPQLSAPDLPPAIVERLKAEFEAQWWEFGFTELFSLVEGPPIDPTIHEQTADLLNQAKRDPRTVFPSYEETYWSEVRGTLDSHLPRLADVFKYLFHNAGHDPRQIKQEQLLQSAEQLKLLLYKGARTTSLRLTVPTLHVGATIYAQMQWDKKRSYKSNDVFDFNHAQAALPYGTAFATDKSLAALLKRTKLADEYSCKILNNAEQVHGWVQATA